MGRDGKECTGLYQVYKASLTQTDKKKVSVLRMA